MMTPTVLVVEDDESLQKMLRMSLSKAGYNVRLASDGLEGKEYFVQHQHEIVLVLTDVLMPKMNGIEMALELLKMRPKIQVIFMSGYMDRMSIPSTLHGYAFLKKPFTPATLVSAVTSACNPG